MCVCVYVCAFIYAHVYRVDSHELKTINIFKPICRLSIKKVGRLHFVMSEL